MKEQDRTIIEAAMAELFGETGDEYQAACRAVWTADNRKREAEEAVQERFRPHWNRIMAIIRRECRKRGVHVTANHQGYQGVEYVRIDKQLSKVSAVGVNHIDYTVSPYIHLEFWLGYGVKLEWSGYAKTVQEFERRFAVLLATLDGYLAEAKRFGKNCNTCGLLAKDIGRCQRCRVCRAGSMWT